MPGHERQERKRKLESEQAKKHCKSIEFFFGAKQVQMKGSPVCNATTSAIPTVSTTIPETVQNRNEDQHDIPRGVESTSSEKVGTSVQKVSKHVVGTKAVLSLNFDWVVIEEEFVDGKATPVIFCKLCRKHNVNSSGGGQTWVKQGFKTLRKDRVKDHENSVQHKKARHLEAQLALNILQEHQASREEYSLAEKLIEIISYIANHNIPLDQFSSLVDLCIKTGSEGLVAVRQACNATYSSPESIHSLLQCLSESVDEYVLPQVRNSSTYALMLDEVCDVAVTKNLGVVVKHIDGSGEAVMKFLHVSEMVRSTGADIKDATLQMLRDKGIKPELCTNLTSDGASSFSGKHKGAAVLLKQEGMPLATVMHCHDHRLALACRDAFAAVDCLDVVSEGLEALYKFYSYSSVSSATLRGLQDLYNQAHWKIQQAKHHRWLSYDKAVVSVLKGLDLVREDLENTSNSENTEFTAKHKVDATAILKWITMEKTIRLLCLLGDILPHLAELSLVFQRQSVDITFIQPKLASTLGIIHSRKLSPGPWERKLFSELQGSQPVISQLNCSQSDFQSNIKVPFLNALEKNLNIRFQNLEVVALFGALSIPMDILEELPSLYREEEIRSLAANFRLDPDILVQEWIGWIDFLKGLDNSTNQPEFSILAMLGKLLLSGSSFSEELRKSYPNLAFLYSAANTMCLSSADVERLFSHLKIVKTDKRSTLSNKVLNWILNVKLNGNVDSSQDIKRQAAKKWLASKRRRFVNYLCL